MDTATRIEISEPWYQGPKFMASLFIFFFAVFVLAWHEQGWDRFPVAFTPLTSVFVIVAVQRGRRVKALEREGDWILIQRHARCKPRFGARLWIDRIPVATATLEWVGSALWLRNLNADGAEAFSPGVLLGYGERAEAVLPWLRAQGIPEPVGR